MAEAKWALINAGNHRDPRQILKYLEDARWWLSRIGPLADRASRSKAQQLLAEVEESITGVEQIIAGRGRLNLLLSIRSTNLGQED
jgi:hypothetical protein